MAYTVWRFHNEMNAAELGRNPVSKHQIQPEKEMSRLTRDGTAEPVSRDQILRHARGQGSIVFPVQLTSSRIGNLTWLIHTLLHVMMTKVVFFGLATNTLNVRNNKTLHGD